MYFLSSAASPQSPEAAKATEAKSKMRGLLVTINYKGNDEAQINAAKTQLQALVQENREAAEFLLLCLAYEHSFFTQKLKNALDLTLSSS